MLDNGQGDETSIKLGNDTQGPLFPMSMYVLKDQVDIDIRRDPYYCYFTTIFLSEIVE